VYAHINETQTAETPMWSPFGFVSRLL